MNRARLETLLAHLKTVPVRAFDIRGWKCGTAACAIGHAGSIPELNLAGFTCGFDPHYQDHTSWDAVKAFFDLERDEVSYHLFNGLAYPDGDATTLPQVIDRLSKFLEAA